MFQFNLYLLNYLNLFIVSFRTKILSPVGCRQHPLRRNSDTFRRFLFECSWKRKLIIICFEIKFASSFILNQYFQLCLNSGRPRCVLPSSPQTVVFRFCRFRTFHGIYCLEINAQFPTIWGAVHFSVKISVFSPFILLLVFVFISFFVTSFLFR